MNVADDDAAIRESLGPKVTMDSIQAMVDDIDEDAMRAMIDKMKEMRAAAQAGEGGEDEMKAKMAREIFNAMRGKMAQQADDVGALAVNRIALVVFCCLVALSLLAFFGYKLYRSLVDKERKREEKKKLKQQKKRK